MVVAYFHQVQCCSYMSFEGLETTLYDDKKSWQSLSDSNKSGVLNNYGTMSTLMFHLSTTEYVSWLAGADCARR